MASHGFRFTVLKIALIFVSILAKVFFVDPAPVKLSSTETKQNSDLEDQLKQQSGENKSSELPVPVYEGSEAESESEDGVADETSRMRDDDALFDLYGDNDRQIDYPLYGPADEEAFGPIAKVGRGAWMPRGEEEEEEPPVGIDRILRSDHVIDDKRTDNGRVLGNFGSTYNHAVDGRNEFPSARTENQSTSSEEDQQEEKNEEGKDKEVQNEEEEGDSDEEQEQELNSENDEVKEETSTPALIDKKERSGSDEKELREDLNPESGFLLNRRKKTMQIETPKSSTSELDDDIRDVNVNFAVRDTV